MGTPGSVPPKAMKSIEDEASVLLMAFVMKEGKKRKRPYERTG